MLLPKELTVCSPWKLFQALAALCDSRLFLLEPSTDAFFFCEGKGGASGRTSEQGVGCSAPAKGTLAFGATESNAAGLRLPV